jgi:two-component system, cell cycle sensor histidine kinase and response regulator CckA
VSKARRPGPARTRIPVPRPQDRVFENAPEALFIHDARGRIVDVNRRACEILGYTRAELQSLTMSDVDQKLARAGQAPPWKPLQAGDALTIEGLQRRKDGTFIPVEYRIGVLEAGDEALYLAAPRGLSGPPRLEEDLRQTQKMDALARLAGGIAHDFNNLLTVIVGFSEMALDLVPQDSPLHADLKEIKVAGERASGMTRQLLAFSRRQPVRPKVLDLGSAVKNLEGMLRRLIPETIHLKMEPGAGLGHIRVDPGQLDQVVLNLALNARDAMPQGGTLTIATSQADLSEDYAARHPGTLPGRYLVLAMSDSGVGIPKDAIPHLFEPFFLKADGKGTGLGLATVFGITQQNGGFISVETELSKGTTFRVYLPRHGEEPPRSNESQVLEAVGGTETILLVEDDAGVRKFAAMGLQTSGYRVLEAGRPSEALALAQDAGFKFDLLMTDMEMPEMTGRQLADRLRERCSGLRVLYFSGYTEDVAFREGRVEPGAGFIAKPFTGVEMLVRVRKALAGRNQGPT